MSSEIEIQWIGSIIPGTNEAGRAEKQCSEKICQSFAKHIGATWIGIKMGPHEDTFENNIRYPDMQHITADVQTLAWTKTHHIYTEGDYPEWHLRFKDNGSPLAIAKDDRPAIEAMREAARRSKLGWRRTSVDSMASDDSASSSGGKSSKPSSLFSSSSMGSIGKPTGCTSFATKQVRPASFSGPASSPASSLGLDGERDQQKGFQPWTPPHRRSQSGPVSSGPRRGACKSGQKYQPRIGDSKNVDAINSWR